MPEHEDSLGLESLLCLDQVLNPELAVVAHFRPQVIDEERLCEIVFIVREWHRLEVQCHHCT